MAFLSTDGLKHRTFTDQFFRRTPFLYHQAQDFFRCMDRAGAEERRRMLAISVKRVLRAAAQSSYYRPLKLPDDIRAWPLLSKNIVRERPNDLSPATIMPAAPAATGGTSGIPLTLKRSWRAVVAEQVALDLLARKAGVDLAQARIAILRGDSIKDPDDMKPPFWVERGGGRRMVLSSNHLCAKTVQDYFRVLRQFAPDVLSVYPSSLEALCGLIGETGAPIPNLRLVISSSEVLRSDVRDRAAAMLNVPVFDQYGQAERVNLASSTRTAEFFFSPGYGINELVYAYSDADHDYYEIIGTSLWNTAQFLIRYQTGDLAVLPKGTVADEIDRIALGLRPFLGIAGRTSEYIETPAGARIIGINQIPRGLQGVVQMQFIQRARDHVEIQVVSERDFPQSLQDRIVRQARTKIPDSVALHLRQVERIERTERGKAPLLIRDLKS